MKRSLQLSGFSIFLVVLLASVTVACPTCGDGIGQSDPQGQSLAAGMYYSILFMMSMPYIILATIGCVFYFHIRRARLANTNGMADADGLPSPHGDSITPA